MCMNGECACNWGYTKWNDSVCLKDSRAVRFPNGELALTRVSVDRQISPHFISTYVTARTRYSRYLFSERTRSRAHKILLCGGIMCSQLRVANSHACSRVVLQFLRLQAPIRRTDDDDDETHLEQTSRACSWKAVLCRILILVDHTISTWKKLATTNFNTCFVR